MLKRIDCSHIDAVQAIAAPSFPKRWSDKDFAYFLAHENGWCRGFFEEEELRGYLLSLVVLGEMDLVSIATDPAYRKKGIAEALLLQAKADAKIKKIFLEVERENQPAISLYKKQGFTIYGERKKYYEGKRDALLMKWEQNGSSP